MSRTTIILEPPCEFLNANQRYHWAKKAELTRTWREAVRTEIETGFYPEYYHRAHFTFAVRFPDNRRRDVHNLYPTAKACVDATVGLLIPDDSDAHIEGPDMRRHIPNGSPLVTITIRPLEDS